MIKTILVATMIMFLAPIGFLACNKKESPPSVNDAPIATAVVINGTAEVGKTLTASYTYSDAEGDSESASVLKWYRADDGTGTGEGVIADSNSTTYTLQEADAGKYIRFGVVPKATSGTSAGVEVKSSFLGAIGEATTVTFTYNGQEVTYNIVNSSKTGKRWLDRNLGAASAPTAVDDYANFGDLFQWGRAADGHQLVMHIDATTATLSGITTTIATNTTPGNALFVQTSDLPFDWLNPQNSNLWQGVDGVNNPCPEGWRIPTLEEWDAEDISNISDGYTKLRLTQTGERFAGSDGFWSSDRGIYWTSTVEGISSRRVSFLATRRSSILVNRASGLGVRCIKE